MDGSTNETSQNIQGVFLTNQTKLAAYIGVSSPYLSLVKNHKAKPSPELIDRCVSATGITAEFWKDPTQTKILKENLKAFFKLQKQSESNFIKRKAA